MNATKLIPYLLCSSALLGVTITTSAQMADTYSRVTIVTQDLPEGLRTVARLGIAVDHGTVRNGISITTDLSGAEIMLLENNGIPFQVDIVDVVNYYSTRNHSGSSSEHEERDFNDPCTPILQYPEPQNFALGTLGGFYTWDAMIGIIDEMHAAYPNLISLKESIGSSIEGRPIYMVRISNDPSVDQNKPEVLYDALHHAREPMGLSQMVYYMWYLLENYGNNTEVTYLVDNLEMYFVPCLNPDGYVFNGTNNPAGGGMWRKNRRINSDGSIGVDLNRNYGEQWGYDDAGSSPIQSSELYRGTEAFSEPETQAMRDFCNAHEFRLALNYHSFGNLLVYPWGYEYQTYTPDSATFVEYGELITQENNYLYGTSEQTVNYAVNGGSDDWMYAEQTEKPKIFSYTPEVGRATDGFWPESNRINELCNLNMMQNFLTAHVALQFAVAKDRSPHIIASTQTTINFDLKRLGQEPGDYTVSLIPLDNVTDIGAPVTFSGMDLLEVRSGTIPLTLSPNLTSGTPVRFVLSVDNGLYLYNDTITKIAGTQGASFTDALNNDNNWLASSWGITTEDFFSPPSSITDSPGSNYISSQEYDLELSSTVDLTNATSASLSFMAKWYIEDEFDYAQVQASTNGITWTPLCGIYTRNGTIYQDFEQPIFDGREPQWVHEQMDLSDFLGGPVSIKFILITDNGGNTDGFYMDDLLVSSTVNGTVNVADLSNTSNILYCAPNPSTSSCTVYHDVILASNNAALNIYDTMGSLIAHKKIAIGAKNTALSTAELGSGVYFVSLVADGVRFKSTRLIVE